MNRYILEDLMFSLNNTDFYMKAFEIGGGYRKVKISKSEFLEWCKSLEDDEQGYELSEYAYFFNN